MTWESLFPTNQARFLCESSRVSLPEECSLVHGACSVENSTYLFEEGSPSCPYQLVHWIQLENVKVKMLWTKLGLLFNLTILRESMYIPTLA